MDRRILARFVLMGFGAVLLMPVPPVHAQAAAEYAGATAGMASVGVLRPKLMSPTMPAGTKTSSTHLPRPAGPPPEMANREYFRQQAGANGLRVNFRSEPAGASVWVDGRFVGQTPVELTLPAGPHQVKLLGPHQEFLERSIVVRSVNSLTFSFSLPPVYPTAIQALSRR